MSNAAAGQLTSPTEAGLRCILATLCLTQITSWGVLYYAFTVLSVRIVGGQRITGISVGFCLHRPPWPPR